MKNKTLIYQEHRSKYCNPNSPRHCGHYVSPIPDANSSVYDEELQAFEKDLSRREDEYLIDLKNFFEGVEKYRKFKFELDEIEYQLKQPIFSIEGTEQQLLNYRKILDDRAKNAELLSSSPEPNDDFSEETQFLHEIENEISQLEQLLNSPMSENALAATKMLSYSQEIETTSSKISEELERKKIKINELKVKLNDDKKNVEALEREEDKMNRIYLKDKSILATLPKLEEVEKLQIEIQNLNKEFIILNERKKSTNILITKINEVNRINIQLSQSLKETSEFYNQFKHTCDNQKSEILTIEKKKKELIKRSNDDNVRKKMLVAKDQMIKRRREELDTFQYKFKLEREKLNEMKKKISQIDDEVEKYEKKAKLMIDKVNEVQEEFQEIEIYESSSTSSIKDLKDLINDKIDSL